MELNWSTFILEIINFLVLVWILKRFFYQPVREVIDRRRQRIDDEVSQAQALRDDAEAMKQQYASRLQEWELEKSKAREALQEEFARERVKAAQVLEASLNAEREKQQVLDARHQFALRRQAEQEALDMAHRFATQLLSRVSGKALEHRLVTLMQEDLTQLPEAQRDSLKRIVAEDLQAVVVVSAYPLEAVERESLEQVLIDLVSVPASFRYECDERLMAGLRINIGPYVLRANIQDELMFFSESVYASPC